jgi:hypothetical protein
MKTKCMSCGGSMKKMAKGGMPSKTPILGPPKKPFAAGIPYFIGAGQTGPSSMKKGGSVKKGSSIKRKTTPTGAPKGMNPLVYFNSLKGKTKAEPKQNLRKAQDGIEMNGYGEDTNMMIDKPGYSSGTKAPVRPKIGYISGRPGEGTPGGRRPMTKEDILNRGKDKNSPYYGMGEEDMINNKMIPKPYKKGGATKAAKFAALAPPYNKATFADRIVGAKKNAKKKK